VKTTRLGQATSCGFAQDLTLPEQTCSNTQREADAEQDDGKSAERVKMLPAQHALEQVDYYQCLLFVRGAVIALIWQPPVAQKSSPRYVPSLAAAFSALAGQSGIDEVASRSSADESMRRQLCRQAEGGECRECMGAQKNKASCAGSDPSLAVLLFAYNILERAIVWYDLGTLTCHLGYVRQCHESSRLSFITTSS
jgi:hypothetical protein